MAAVDLHPLGGACRIELRREDVTVLDAAGRNGSQCLVGLPVAARSGLAGDTSCSGRVHVVGCVDSQAADPGFPRRPERVTPDQVTVLVELRHPCLTLLVVAIAVCQDDQLVGGGGVVAVVCGVEVHLDWVGPTTDDDVAGVVDDHGLAPRGVGSTPRVGPKVGAR